MMQPFSSGIDFANGASRGAGESEKNSPTDCKKPDQERAPERPEVMDYAQRDSSPPYNDSSITHVDTTTFDVFFTCIMPIIF